ncbi:MAG: type III-A CRISPR-associated protein Cas10/Csm1 [Ignavibacteriaceae bacterium]
MNRIIEEKNIIYLSALLHDIGKFIERAKNKNIQTDASLYHKQKIVSKNYAHRRYSAWFIDKFKAQKDFLNSEKIKTLVLWHHRGDDNTCEDYEPINSKGVLLKLLRIADDLASSERRMNSELVPVDYYSANIQSPFQDIQLIVNQKLLKLEKINYLNTQKLTLGKNSGFPIEQHVNIENKYTTLVSDFLGEFENVEDEDKLLYLLEKYLVNVPAQTPIEINGKEVLYKPDLNLYDHSRSVAAIAVCLFLEYQNGSWRGKDELILKPDYALKELDPPMILINGNLSGIQDFIFDVKSEKAAQKLKGKSFFIQLLTDVCVKYLIEKLELKLANVIYNGGGNFFILAPAYKEEQLNDIIIFILNILKNLNLFIAFGVTKVGLNDFNDFSEVFRRVTKESQKSKQTKFKQLTWENVFSPTEQKLEEDKLYKELTGELIKSKDYYIREYRKDEKHSQYQQIFKSFGLMIEFHTEKTGISQESIIFNSTDFNDYKGFRFAVKDLPLWKNNNITEFEKFNSDNYNIFEVTGEDELFPGSIISFERMSQFAYFETGTRKLGVLKMDIDNLGKIFSEGLPKEIEYRNKIDETKKESLRTISRIASISRSIKWFFEGYMNTLISLPEYKDRLYVVFSGGDDFFVVGAWNKVFDFVEKVRNDFVEFVCYHPAITLSASLLVIDEKFPVSRFAKIAEDRLHKAKYESDAKNSISVFDMIISWEDYIKARLLKEKLVELVKLTGKRAIIEKVKKSTRGFSKIQLQAQQGRVEMKRVWRLAYYLRDLINSKKQDKDFKLIQMKVEEIVKQYEELIFLALNGESFSIKIFPVAARWAEFETKNIKEK